MLGFWSGKKFVEGQDWEYSFFVLLLSLLSFSPLSILVSLTILFPFTNIRIGSVDCFLSSLFFSCVSLCFVLLAIRHSSLAIVLSLFLCFICVL
jgi:hypothetical protein